MGVQLLIGTWIVVVIITLSYAVESEHDEILEAIAAECPPPTTVERRVDLTLVKDCEFSKPCKFVDISTYQKNVEWELRRLRTSLATEKFKNANHAAN
jgi:hypothetical protein